MPDITVVIPTFNRLPYLRQAVASCLRGGVDDVEVLVVDDGSTDGTRAYLADHQDPRLCVISQAHRGGQHARNRGMAAARGTYVKFLDDDDWLAEGALARELDVLRRTEADLCYGYFHRTRDGAVVRTEPAVFTSDLVSTLLQGASFTIPLNVTYRRTFAQALHWDLDLPCRQDYSFVLEAAMAAPRWVQSRVCTGYKRVHAQSLSRQIREKVDHHAVHVCLLTQAVDRLRRENRLTVRRRVAAAQGLWMYAHLQAAHDWNGFASTYALVCDLVPGFRPPRARWMLRLLDAVLGVRATERMWHLAHQLRARVALGTAVE